MNDHGVLLTVSYDGTAFSGWALQKKARTVEQTLRGAVLALDPRATGPRGCSRTDAGVHADGQLAAFDTSVFMPPRGWVLRLNQHLPEDVTVRAARPVQVGFNPRFMSQKKRYRYWIMRDKVPDALLRHRAWRVGFDMNMERMIREARAIEGTHDFAAFRAARDVREVTVRTMTRVAVEPLAFDPRLWVISIEGTSFLYNMVRILVGTLVDVARDHLPEGAVARALEAKERAFAGQTAPAHGLTLAHIDVDLAQGAGAPWPP